MGILCAPEFFQIGKEIILLRGTKQRMSDTTVVLDRLQGSRLPRYIWLHHPPPHNTIRTRELPYCAQQRRR